MPKHNPRVLTPELERQLDGLTDATKLRRLLTLIGGTMRDYAQSRGLQDTQIHLTLAGEREYPQIRQTIAEDVGWPRERVDAAIEAERERRSAAPAA